MPRILCIFDTGYACQVQIIMISLEGDRRQKGLFAMYVSVALNWEGRFFVCGEIYYRIDTMPYTLKSLPHIPPNPYSLLPMFLSSSPTSSLLIRPILNTNPLPRPLNIPPSLNI